MNWIEMCKANLFYFIFLSLIIGLFKTALAKHLYYDQSPHAHLEPVIQDFLRFSNIDWKFILPTIRGILVEHSDLIKGLQERETHSDFLPYISEYEALKGSPINPSIRIFFYDGSRFPLNHLYQINHARGVCFSGLNFIFTDIRYWSTTVSHTLLDKQIHNLILDSYANGEIILSSRLLYLKGYAYKRMSDEERNLYKQNFVRSEEQKEERLSHTEKSERREFFRRIHLFHELGHCDLNRGHEDHNDSIMGREFTRHINKILSEEYPYIDLNDFFDSLIDELFSKKDTRYTIYSDNAGLFADILTFINRLNPWSIPTESEFITYLRRSLQDLNQLESIMVTDEHLTNNILPYNH